MSNVRALVIPPHACRRPHYPLRLAPAAAIPGDGEGVWPDVTGCRGHCSRPTVPGTWDGPVSLPEKLAAGVGDRTLPGIRSRFRVIQDRTNLNAYRAIAARGGGRGVAGLGRRLAGVYKTAVFTVFYLAFC